jgi:hypothetical protein
VTLAAVEPVKPAKPSEPSSEERRAWDRIKDSADRAKMREFVAKYPSSPLAETAQNRLATLDRAAQEREDKARADRDAAKQREEEARVAKAAEAERNLSTKTGRPQGEACKRDEERLARLRASISQGWAREDLKRLERETACDGVRSEVVALLAQPTTESARQPTIPQEPPANSPELVRSAQAELRRIGCFAGRDDGNLSGATKEAIVRYLSQKGESAREIKVTEGFVAALKDQSGRTCALTCSRGEHPEGDRCVADAKPEKKEKPKATVRQRDEDEDRPSRRAAKPKREEPKREASRPKPERKAERQKPAQQPARSQASRSGGGGMVGVGF